MLAIASALYVGGCAGGSPYAGAACLLGQCSSPVPSPSPSPSGSPAAVLVGLNVNATPTTDPTFGAELGFLQGTATTQSSTIHVPVGSTIQFVDVEPGTAHTAADLGKWSGKFPANGPNPSATMTPAGMDISIRHFTTGNLGPPGGNASAIYTADLPGMYVFGCAYHYGQGMRTVVIVQ